MVRPWDTCVHVLFYVKNVDLPSPGLSLAHGIFSWDRQTLSCGMWDLVPWSGIKPGHPALGMCGVLATGAPGKSLRIPPDMFLLPHGGRTFVQCTVYPLPFS